MTDEERRKKERVARSVPVKIKEKDNIFSSETIDMSASGVYCRTMRPMSLLSKVAVTLVIPAIIDGKKTNRAIDCKGTIVRTHPVVVEGETIGYDVAIFFDELKDGDRTLICEYIDRG